ncbi:aminoacyl-tRNA hydrolase [Pararhodospirillum photometricum]|uniref:Peptidyl-tRNA hydrolase n=1 Tax=Pararhodospirillum photometricum DSM 122 TaxID=1150469 RepID=H6SPM9_PARPM|nr:aminoacyl-tRNA hydrolase [Pararhodospirillum photometricum]CCG09554.1 Peptidyl-tRNA hydrolase [Pararhodospirillum photometricum DSM 122]
MKLVVGLGNPGPRYSANRHNIGAMAVDRVARRLGLGPFRSKFQGRIAEGSLEGQRALLLLPETYMNLSGQSVAEAVRFHKIALADVVVLHDDLDLAPGKVKIKQGGGHGGHNGLRNIDAHLGPEYWRIRLGVGHPGHKDKVSDYVLSDFAKAEQVWLDPLLDAVADTLALVLQGRASDAMSKIAATLTPPRPHPPKPAEPAQAPRRAAPLAPGASSPPDTGLAAALARALDSKNQKGTG